MQTSELQFLALLYSTNERSNGTFYQNFLLYYITLVDNYAIDGQSLTTIFGSCVTSDSHFKKLADHLNIVLIILYVYY